VPKILALKRLDGDLQARTMSRASFGAVSVTVWRLTLRPLETTEGPSASTGGLKRRFFLLARLCRPALSRSGGICCSRLLRLIFLHESISLLSHAPPRRFVRCADVKIGMAEGYVALALLKQRRVVPDSLAIGSYPSHFGLTRHAAKIHAERGDHANG